MLYEDNATLFEMEEKDLMRDLRDLPRNSAIRKINELVKRVRLAKVHAYIIGHLKEQMPMLLGQTKKQQQLMSFYEFLILYFVILIFWLLFDHAHGGGSAVDHLRWDISLNLKVYGFH